MAKLDRVVFRDCRMAECDFYEALLTDVLFEHCELREATVSGVKLKRVELRRCDLAGLRGVEALRGARMPWNDVLENGPLFAACARVGDHRLALRHVGAADCVIVQASGKRAGAFGARSSSPLTQLGQPSTNH